ICGCIFFFSSRRRHTRLVSDWSSDVCSSDLRLAASGVGILYVTHRLDELTGFADRATVLRDGHRVGEVDIASEGTRRLVALITEIGRASCRGRGKSWVGGEAVGKKERERRER